ncbi:putative protein TPRXL [Arachis ipaensis]|nr:putative protein TPRXL [Arachis ipaensis]
MQRNPSSPPRQPNSNAKSKVNEDIDFFKLAYAILYTKLTSSPLPCSILLLKLTMGSCISKCKPQHTKNVVQDKLVISQASPPPIILLPPKYKISPSPPSPTSSFTCTAATTTTTTTISSSSSSSSLSSASSFTSKDRSFSNEFLLSCYKDNPQISRINSLTHHHAITSPSFSNNQKTHNKVLASSSTHKRLRSNSPTNLTRQKSFRKDSSPSPSTRFINTNGGDYYKYSANSSSMDTSTVSKRMNGSPKVSSVQSCSRCCASSRNNNKAGASPNNNLGRLQCSSGLRHRAMTRTLRVGSKIDENVVKQVVSSSNNSNNNDMDLDLVEDIDNPLISLDCFIFL